MPRKKNPPTKYYGDLQEQAVIQFLNAETFSEKEQIYREHLESPINRMIESIIRTYRLQRKSHEFKDIHADALSFLITKFEKFKPEKKKKSFSYFGTICRNYLYGEMVKEYKRNIKHVEYDTSANELIERDDMVYYIDNETEDLSQFIFELVDQIKDELNNQNLNENEIKVGYALINVLENWYNLFGDADGSPKFNKNLVLLYLRNMTGLTTKEIRNAMKGFKILYNGFKKHYFDF